MNRPHFRTSHNRPEARNDDKGFTLVEILIAIVLVGILSAVVVVGISNLTSKGSTSACQASADAAKAGAVVYFASVSPNAYPTTMLAMTTSNPPALTLPSGVTINPAAVAGPPAVAAGQQATGASWTLTMTPGAAGVPPTFVCT